MTKITPLSLNKQKFLGKLQQKKYRHHYKIFICEGFKLLITAISQKNITINEIVVTESVLKGKNGRQIKKISSDYDIALYLCEEKVMNKLSDEITPANILFTVEMNLYDFRKLKYNTEDNIVCLEKISDPGNLGTIIRTSAWFGVNTIMLTSGCVDPYNPKTIRASAGAIFNTRIFIDIDMDLIITSFKTSGYHLLTTVLKDGINLKEYKKGKKNIIFFGSEAAGISEEILKNAETKISIPGYSEIESLNVSVAAGIIFYHLSQLKDSIHK